MRFVCFNVECRYVKIDVDKLWVQICVFIGERTQYIAYEAEIQLLPTPCVVCVCDSV